MMPEVTYYSGPFSLIVRRTGTGKDETPVRQRYSDPDGGPSVLVPGKEATAAEAMDLILLQTFNKEVLASETVINKTPSEQPPWSKPGGALDPSTTKRHDVLPFVKDIQKRKAEQAPKKAPKAPKPDPEARIKTQKLILPPETIAKKPSPKAPAPTMEQLERKIQRRKEHEKFQQFPAQQRLKRMPSKEEMESRLKKQIREDVESKGPIQSRASKKAREDYRQAKRRAGQGLPKPFVGKAKQRVEEILAEPGSAPADYIRAAAARERMRNRPKKTYEEVQPKQKTAPRIEGKPPKVRGKIERSFVQGVKGKPIRRPKTLEGAKERGAQLEARLAKIRGKVALASGENFNWLIEFAKESALSPGAARAQQRRVAAGRAAREKRALEGREALKRRQEAENIAKEKAIRTELRGKGEEKLRRAEKPSVRPERRGMWEAFKKGLKGEKYQPTIERERMAGAEAPVSLGKVERKPGIGERASHLAGRAVGGTGRAVAAPFKFWGDVAAKKQTGKGPLTKEEKPFIPESLGPLAEETGYKPKREPKPKEPASMAGALRLGLTPVRAVTKPLGKAFGAGLRGLEYLAPIVKGERVMALPKEIAGGAGLAYKRRTGEVVGLREGLGEKAKRAARGALGFAAKPISGAREKLERAEAWMKGKPLPERKIEPAQPRGERALEKRVPKGFLPFMETALKSQRDVSKYHSLKEGDPRKAMELQRLGGEKGLKAHEDIVKVLEDVQSGRRVDKETLMKRIKMMRGKEALPTDVGAQRAREKAQKGLTEREKRVKKRMAAEPVGGAAPSAGEKATRTIGGAAEPTTRPGEEPIPVPGGGRVEPGVRGMGGQLGQAIMGPQAGLSGYRDPASHVIGEAPNVSAQAKQRLTDLLHGTEGKKFIGGSESYQRRKLEQIAKGLPEQDRAQILGHAENFFAPRKQLAYQEVIPGTPAPTGKVEVPAQWFQVAYKESPEWTRKAFGTEGPTGKMKHPELPGEFIQTYEVDPHVAATLQEKFGDKLKYQDITRPVARGAGAERFVGEHGQDIRGMTHIPGQPYKPATVVERPGGMAPEQPFVTPSGQAVPRDVMTDIFAGTLEQNPRYQRWVGDQLQQAGLSQPGGWADAITGGLGFIAPYVLASKVMGPEALGGMGPFFAAQMMAPMAQNWIQGLFGQATTPQLMALRRQYIARALGQGAPQQPAAYGGAYRQPVSSTPVAGGMPI